MRMPALLLLVLVLAGCAAPETPRVAPIGGPDAASIRPPAVGDTLEYRLIDGYLRETVAHLREEVVAIDDGRVRSHKTDVTRGTLVEEIVTVDGRWIRKARPRLPLQRFEPPLVTLPQPLRVGVQWQARATVSDDVALSPFGIRLDGRVEGWDRVEVPAGVFDALRIRRTVWQYDSSFRQGNSRVDEVAWFAPAIGAIVRYENRSGHADPSGRTRWDSGWIRGDWNILELSAVHLGPDRR